MKHRELTARVIHVREALEAGDLDLGLRSVLQLERDLVAGSLGRGWQFPCPYCTARYRWPGELEQHLLVHHPGKAATHAA